MKCPPHRFGASAALLAAVLVLAIVDAVFAASIAEDSASDAAYAADLTGAWKGLNSTVGENPVGSDNGGFGFETWNFAGGFHDPAWSPYGSLNHFIDGVDFAASSFNNLGGPAFGLTNANRPFFGYTARASRSFAPLEIGSTLSVEFDNPLLQPLDPFSSSGFLFRLNTGGGPVIADNPIPGVKERFGLATTSGFNGDRWYVSDAQNFTDTAVTDNDTASGTQFVFTRTGEEAYSVSLSRLSDGHLLYSYNGMLKNVGTGPIDTLEITLFGNGSGGGMQSNVPSGEREFFFKSLEIITPGDSLGDFDNDGDVDGRDFLYWQRDPSVGNLADWQANYGGGLLLANAAGVPEPTSLVVLLACQCISLPNRRVFRS
jgi:hypothetical protein